MKPTIRPKGMRPIPPEMKQDFIESGWERVEKRSGKRTSSINKSLHLLGFRINADDHYELDGITVRELRKGLKG
jgi:aspartate aminotransferase-like enzyme